MEKVEKVKSMGLFYLGPFDYIQFSATNSLADAVTVQVRGSYFIDDDLNEARPFVQPLVIGAYSTNGIAMRLGRCWLKTITIAPLNNDALQCGDVLVAIQILKGMINSPIYALATLIDDYVYSDYDPSWPTLAGLGPNKDNWSIRVIEQAVQPALGAEFLYTVPARLRLHFKSIRFSLACSAVVANRRPSLVIDNGAAGNMIARISSQTVVAGGATQIYSFVSGYPISNVIFPTAEVQDPYPPDIVLYPGCRIRTLTDNLDAGDQYTIGAMWTRTQAMRITP